jgi:hypothetical protein
MIAISALSLLLAGTLQDPPKATFTHPDTGLVFDYPATWTNRKVRTGWEFTIPAPEGRTAKLELIGLVYSGESEIWQIGQADAAKQAKRTVDRQWQEELLNCPLLLTQTSWTQGEMEMRGESGIIYSQTPRKLVYRLTAPKIDFEAALASFRESLQTMRTDDGSVLRPFDPNSTPSQAEANALRSAPTRNVWRSPDPKTPKIERAKQQIEGTAAGRKVHLFFPDKWIATAKAGDRFELTSKDVTGVVTVETLSTLDSPAPGRTMLRYAGESLAKFTSVDRREEPMPMANRAGMVISWISREGKDANGALMTFEAVGANSGNEYFSVRWTSTDARSARRQRDQIVELVRRMSIELVP